MQWQHHWCDRSRVTRLGPQWKHFIIVLHSGWPLKFQIQFQFGRCINQSASQAKTTTSFCQFPAKYFYLYDTLMTLKLSGTSESENSREKPWERGCCLPASPTTIRTKKHYRPANSLRPHLTSKHGSSAVVSVETAHPSLACRGPGWDRFQAVDNKNIQVAKISLGIWKVIKCN